MQTVWRRRKNLSDLVNINHHDLRTQSELAGSLEFPDAEWETIYQSSDDLLSPGVTGRAQSLQGWGSQDWLAGSDTTGSRALTGTGFWQILFNCFLDTRPAAHSASQQWDLSICEINWNTLVKQPSCSERKLWSWHILFEFNKAAGKWTSSVIIILTVNIGNWGTETRRGFNNLIFVSETHIWVASYWKQFLQVEYEGLVGS